MLVSNHKRYYSGNGASRQSGWRNWSFWGSQTTALGTFNRVRVLEKTFHLLKSRRKLENALSNSLDNNFLRSKTSLIWSKSYWRISSETCPQCRILCPLRNFLEFWKGSDDRQWRVWNFLLSFVFSMKLWIFVCFKVFALIPVTIINHQFLFWWHHTAQTLFKKILDG